MVGTACLDHPFCRPQMEERSQAPSPGPCRSRGGCWSASSAANVSTAGSPVLAAPWPYGGTSPLGLRPLLPGKSRPSEKFLSPRGAGGWGQTLG